MPRPTSFGKDTGLQIRMALTLFLLGAAVRRLRRGAALVLQSAVPVIMILVGLAALQFFASDKLALAAMGARVVTPQEAPQLHAMIERLAADAGIPKPKVAISSMAMPNAFATGRNPRTRSSLSRRLMAELEPHEVEAVLGHEITHVINRDVAVMTLASFFAMLAFFLMRMFFFTGCSAAEMTTTRAARSGWCISSRWSSTSSRSC